MEPFTVTLAINVELLITPMRKPVGTFYKISTEGQIHGSIFPVIDNHASVLWKSLDAIHPHIVNLIGNIIEEHIVSLNIDPKIR